VQNCRVAVILALAVSAVAFSANASAQQKTRAEVRQELIEAECNSRNFVTDTSYPDISPIYEQQAARLKLLHDSGGAERSGAGAADGGPAEGACTGSK
jgi:Domain of unknown function (DUF4148)